MKDYSNLSKDELQEELEMIDAEVEEVELAIKDIRNQIDELECDIDGHEDDICDLRNDRLAVMKELIARQELEKPDPNQLNML